MTPAAHGVENAPHGALGRAPLSGGVSRHERDRSDHDDGDPLAGFGYRQQLDRSIGRFASFAAGVSYISILTGTFQLFYFGFGAGGPAYRWSWPMVFVGQLMVALCFAELAARYPGGRLGLQLDQAPGQPHDRLAGRLDDADRLGRDALGRRARYQFTLPQIWSGFQLVGDGTGTYDFAVNAVILGSALIVFTTLVNVFGVKLMSRINSTGVFIELVAAVLHHRAARGEHDPRSRRRPRDERRRARAEPGLPGRLPGGRRSRRRYVMYGFDTASSLGEETVDPRRTAPRAILRAVTASFVLGGLILLFGVMAVEDIRDPELSSSTGGLQYVLLQASGTGIGRAFLLAIVVAITVCCLAVHTATIRMMFGMARDNNLPGAARLARVHPRFRTPVVPAVVIGLLSIGILLVNIRQPQIFTVVTSIAIMMIYLAYLLVTVPMLVSRLRGRWPRPTTAAALLPGALGPAGERARGGLGGRHGDQPRLAAAGGLQRHGALPLVPAVGGRRSSSARSRWRASPTTGSAAAPHRRAARARGGRRPVPAIAGGGEKGGAE